MRHRKDVSCKIPYLQMSMYMYMYKYMYMYVLQLQKYQKWERSARFSQIFSAAPLGFRSGGTPQEARPRGGSGGGAKPPDAKEFSKFCKSFFKKIAKMHYCSIFSKRFNKSFVNFSRVLTINTNCWEILSNFLKISIKIQLKN